MPNLNISVSDELLAKFDAICQREDRLRPNMFKQMVERWDGQVSPQASASPAPRRAKAEKETPAGADGVLVRMQTNNPATLPVGSKWLRKVPGALPFIEGFSTPEQEMERVRATKANPNGVKMGKDHVVRDERGYPRNPPVYVVMPDDPEDTTATWRVFRRAAVADIEGVSHTKNVYWVRHHWNEALAQWVVDAEHITALVDHTADKVDGIKMWSNQQAYGAVDDAQLKELLTTLEPLYNLTDDAKAFIAS